MKLSKNAKTLIASISVLVVLGVVLTILLLTQPHEEKTPDVAEDPSLTFSSYETLDVVKIHIINIEDPDGYTIIPSDTKGEWTIPSIEKAPLNQTQFSSVVYNAAAVKASELVEKDVADLKKYGLENPAAQVAITYKDNNTLEFLIGDATPGGGYYLAKKGSSDVYLYVTTKASAFLQSRYAFVSLKVMESYDTQEAPTINRLSIERIDLEEPIVFEAIPTDTSGDIPSTFQTHRIVSPVQVLADVANASNVLYGLYDLTAVKAVSVGLAEADYTAAGLDRPTCVVTMRSGGKTYTLTIGKAYYENPDSNEDPTVSPDGYYGVFSEVPDVLYVFSPTALPWLTTTVESVMSRLFLMPYIYSLDSVTIKTNDDTYVMGISGDPSNHVFTFNGVQAEKEEAFKQLYQFLISASGNEIYLEDEKDEFICSITYSYRDKTKNPKDDVVEFYHSHSDLKTIIFVNGNPAFKCRQMYVTRLLENIQAYLKGEEIIDTW